MVFIDFAACLQKILRMALQQAQHATQSFKQPRQLRRLCAVDFGCQFKQNSHRFRGAEVFVHGGLETRGVSVLPIDGHISGGRCM